MSFYFFIGLVHFGLDPVAVSFILYTSKMKMPKQSSTVDKTLTPHILKTEPHFKKSPIVPFIRITLPLFPMKFFLFQGFKHWVSNCCAFIWASNWRISWRKKRSHPQTSCHCCWKSSSKLFYVLIFNTHLFLNSYL